MHLPLPPSQVLELKACATLSGLCVIHSSAHFTEAADESKILRQLVISVTIPQLFQPIGCPRGLQRLSEKSLRLGRSFLEPAHGQPHCKLLGEMGGWGRDRPSCGSHHPRGLCSLQPHSFTSEDGVQETSFFPTLSQEAGRAGRRVERKYSWSTRPRRRQDGSLVSSGNYCHCVTLDRPHFIWAAASIWAQSL